MKLMSKILNYRVTLQPSVPAVTLAGGQMIASAQAGIYALFVDGLLSLDESDPKQAKICELIKSHQDWGTEFWQIDNEQATLAAYQRPRGSGIEPEHDMMNIEFGHVGKQLNPRSAVKVSPEMQKFLSATAAKMAQEMLHKLMESGDLIYNDKKTQASEVEEEEVKTSKIPEEPRAFASAPSKEDRKPEELKPPAPIEADGPDMGESKPEPGIDLKPNAKIAKAKK